MNTGKCGLNESIGTNHFVKIDIAMNPLHGIVSKTNHQCPDSIQTIFDFFERGSIVPAYKWFPQRSAYEGGV